MELLKVYLIDFRTDNDRSSKGLQGRKETYLGVGVSFSREGQDPVYITAVLKTHVKGTK